jgi:hypothetical protein
MLSKLSQTQKNKYYIFYLICEKLDFKIDMKVERVLFGMGKL